MESFLPLVLERDLRSLTDQHPRSMAPQRCLKISNREYQTSLEISSQLVEEERILKKGNLKIFAKFL